jgi:hypothetical protein
MTAPKPTTGSVEELRMDLEKFRKNLFINYAALPFPERYQLTKDLLSECERLSELLAAAQAEGARRAVEEIEKLVPLVCWKCREKYPINENGSHYEEDSPNKMTANCDSRHLLAALHRLKAEAGDVAKEGR